MHRGTVQLAVVPRQLFPGSPFGDSIAVLVTSLRCSYTISYTDVASDARGV